MDNRPRARRKFIGGGSSGGFGGSTRGSGGGRMPFVIILLILLLGGGGGFGAVNGIFGDGTGYTDTINSGSGVSSGWYETANTGKLDTSVADEARQKFTTIKGGGRDTVTLMVYMCGTDLESRSGMATKDLQEMLKADVGSNVNLIIYTGGCSRWQNNVVSSRYNQIYQIKNGKLICLDSKAGTDSMTDPDTLSYFIRWASGNYPANRYQLIFWDHGGGSVSGYGYDEKELRSGSMTLSEIKKALSDGGIKYDFVGFDACLMATTETAAMLGNYADYMIGSEETEPGIGWYYTNWLSALSADTSMDTLTLGKMIADEYVSYCAGRCPGQQATLSVTDLAELSQTLPDKLAAFSSDTTGMLKDGAYKEVATARTGAREFARSSRIDQIDFVHFAKLLDTVESRKLADTLLSAVKYNRTSSNINNAYGLSIYFPYQKYGSVDSISKEYAEIGLDESYSSCIKSFAQIGVSGQAAAGGTSNPVTSLFGDTGSSMSSQGMSQLIGQLFGGRSIKKASIDGLDSSNTAFMTEGEMEAEEVSEYIEANRLDAEDLEWKENKDGKSVISMDEVKWSLVTTADMNMLLKTDGGYIDLGLDNVFDFDDDGNLLPENDGTWIALNGHIMAYYHLDTTETGGGYQITGRVPVKVNGEKADLILVFTDENEQGSVAGVRYDTGDSKNETTAKTDTGLKSGDRITFLTDYYNNDGDLDSDYSLGTMTVRDPENLVITNEYLDSGEFEITYKFTDIYGQDYWTPTL